MNPLEALHSAGSIAGIDTTGQTLLRAHSAYVYLLPQANAVARLSRPEHPGLRPSTAATVAAWLVGIGFPATEPLLDHGVVVDDITVTFWCHYPQRPEAPPAGELGRLLHRLHRLPTPPMELPPYRPLLGLQAALQTSDSLSADDRAWLAGRTDALVEQYNALDSALGIGFVHGDAYPGNTLWDDQEVLLGDWDEASIAPRELDLANTYQGIRFGRTEAELDDFTSAYGWDVRSWPGFPVLRDMRDLHTLAGFIRRSSNDSAAATELRHRLDVLRRGESINGPWHAA